MLILFVLLFNFLPVHSSHDQDTTWAMHIPKNKAVPQVVNHENVGCYDFLEKLGQMADDYWLMHKDYKKPHEFIEIYQELFSIVDAFFLIKVIDEILSSQNILSRITDASYKNSTGFLKIVLIDSGKKSWRLRLHIWDQDKAEGLHNHKWDFYSKVLSGNLLQEVHEKVSEDHLNDVQKYSVREPVSLMPLDLHGDKPCPCRGNYSLNYKSSDQIDNYVYLKKASTTLIPQDASYFMPHELIHAIAPSKDAVTFVFTSQQVQENSEVFLLNTEEHDIGIERYAPSVTSDEVRLALQDVKNKLQEQINEQR